MVHACRRLAVLVVLLLGAIAAEAAPETSRPEPGRAPEGISVRVRGRGLAQVTGVRVAGVDATFSIVSDGELRFVVPRGAAGTGVAFRDAGGWSGPVPFEVGPLRAWQRIELPPGPTTGTYRSAEVIGNAGRRLIATGPCGLDTCVFSTDGTSLGTLRVGTLLASEGPSLGRVGTAGDRLLMKTYRYRSDTSDLWTSDGTAAGTQPIATFDGELAALDQTGRHPRGSTAWDRKLLFGRLLHTHGNDGNNYHWDLGFSDGTPGGTWLFTTPPAPWITRPPWPVTALGRELLFTYDDGIEGSELWVSDGSPAGTHLAVSFGPGTAPGYPGDLGGARLADRALFFAQTYAGGALHSSDGTPGGTTPFFTLSGGIWSDSPLAGCGGHAYFVNPSSGVSYLWATAGDAASTLPIVPARPRWMACAGADRSRLVFLDEPWRLLSSDGSPAGTRLLVDLASLVSKVEPAPSGRLLLSVQPPTAPTDELQDLWTTDGTPDGTRLLAPRSLPPSSSQGPGAFAHDRLVLASGTSSLRSLDMGPTRADSSGDGRADVLWRRVDGTVVLWALGGAWVDRTVDIAQVTDTAWEVVGRADLDGDGRADLLWRNRNDGALWCWLMGAEGPASYVQVATVDPAWSVAAVADFDDDGRADLLWRQAATGALYLWKLDGARIRTIEPWASVPPAFVLAGAADLDGDNSADVLWLDPATVRLYAWMTRTGGPQAALVAEGEPGGRPEAVADFDGDGRADVVWRQSNGVRSVWALNGSSILRSQVLPSMADPDTAIVRAEDFDGDGHADLLWRSASTGKLTVWLMDGATLRRADVLGKAPVGAFTLEP